MTRTRHDAFAKHHLAAMLGQVGEVVTSLKITSETREVDLWFVPRPDTQRERKALGLLGRMSTRRLQSDRPQLWILSPTLSDRMLQHFGAMPRWGWSQGVYFLPPGQPARLVAIHQLPVTPKTLWLRLMGRGQVQVRAIEELLALPDDYPFKRETIEHLAILQIEMQTSDNLGVDDRGLVMSLHPVYDKWLEETEQRVRQEERQELVLRQLPRRVGELPDRLQDQVRSLSLMQLEELAEALLDFASLEDLTAWLDAHPVG